MQAELDRIEPLRRDCALAGFDLVQPLQVGWYNAKVSGTLRLEDYGQSSNLALVIGNTRALWPKFLSALRSEPQRLAAAHPLYAYTEQHISRAVAALGVPATVRWSHSGGAQLVAMQRLAHAAGLAYLSESQLSVHPVHGPWIGLRAAVSVDLPGPAGPEPELSHPCGSCEGRCRPAFERAIHAIAGPPGAATMARDWQSNWQLWLACRDACPTGREYRYADEQIRYHYLKDRELLHQACSRPPGPA